jgi:hypothetical protein
MGEELFDVTSQADGRYVLDFVLADSDQVVTAALWGYRFDTVRVHLVPGEVDTIDFALARGYVDPFELDLGWQLGWPDDGATGGLWERVSPVETRNFAGYQAQPADDYEAGPATRCLVTGQARPGDQVNITDVDLGHVSAVSPYFDLSRIDHPVLSFKYWFVNDAGDNPSQDTLWFELTSDSGLTWAVVGFTPYPLASWWTFNANLTVARSWPQPLRFRVRAGDSGGESVVEAALDAFEIRGDYLSAPPGDMDQSGSVTAADIVYLVNYIFKGGAMPLGGETGDVNQTCSASSADVIYLVNFVFRSGPGPMAPCAP